MKIDDLRTSWSAEIYRSDSDAYNSYQSHVFFVFDTKPPTTRWHSNSKGAYRINGGISGEHTRLTKLHERSCHKFHPSLSISCQKCVNKFVTPSSICMHIVGSYM